MGVLADRFFGLAPLVGGGMNQYEQALAQAGEMGYLVTGNGSSWLGCEIKWRRHCTAQGKPTVVVSRRTKLADVYMFLRNVPHADISDKALQGMLDDLDCDDVTPGQINIIRGRQGCPNLFIGLSVSDIPVASALALAPSFLEKARALVVGKQDLIQA
jgi:hypothetical protein